METSNRGGLVSIACDRMVPPARASWFRRCRIAVLALGGCIGLAAGVQAQEDDLEAIFGGLGTAEQEDAAPIEDGGVIAGRVFDGETGAGIANATVILIWPTPEDSGEPRQDVQVTAGDGSYEFPPVPEGRYTISFIKAGYRASNLTDFEVAANQVKRADFPMPPVPVAPGGDGDILELDAFVVDESAVSEMMDALEIRLESDQVLDVMSAEDLSRFAASDVADALKRVAGVNIVEGQFAIIRGLEERYSSTTFNGAPVPSPDPDRQSVQLDLFPSDIVSNLEIAKTFAAASPSNSSGGSVDIATTSYPDVWTARISGGTGFHDRARDEFLAYQDDGGGGGPTPIGKPEDGKDVLEHDVSAFLGGRQEVGGRELRLLGSYSQELDFATAEGAQQDFEPAAQVTFPPRDARPGDLALGVASLPGARWDLTRSLREERESIFVSTGFDFDRDGRHQWDASVFLTRNDDESVERRENGAFPQEIYERFSRTRAADQGGGRYAGAVAPTEWVGLARQDASSGVRFGQMWYAPVYEGRTFERERELDLYQLNGKHDLGGFSWLEGLTLDWAANYATTEQKETQLNVRYFFEPDNVEALQELPGGSLPLRPEQLGAGLYSTRSDIVFGINEIDEEQLFGRADLEYEFDPYANLGVTLNGGVWYELAERDVESRFNTVFSGQGGRPGVVGNGTIFSIQGRTIEEMGARIFRGIGLDQPLDPRTSESEREILAGHVGGKATLFDDLDLLAGVRLEQLRITSTNDPFVGLCSDNTPSVGDACPAGAYPLIFPNAYVLFDRLDNPNIVEESVFARLGVVNNSDIVGIAVTPDPSTGFVDYRDAARIRGVVNGEIDEFYTLPTVGLTYRFAALSRTRDWLRLLEDLTFRGAFSQTVARPSFRELGYYASLRSNDDTILLGNPQLEPSEVTSYDARLEYLWNDYGDLLAASAFLKDVEKPIESVTVRDPFGTGIDTYRTFKNNPSDADVLGVELEGRLTFGVFHDLLEPFSVGGNGTYIWAEVDQPEQLRGALGPYFAVTDAERAAGIVVYEEYEKTRRLTSQPEWIANADVSFDHEDWGTKVTLAMFAISDVLDATAATDYNRAGQLVSFGLDRYTASFYQFDLVASQSFSIPYVPGEWTLKGSVKNLTDTRRAVIYDRQQTIVEIEERRFKIGRDYSLALSYQIEFGGGE